MRRIAIACGFLCALTLAVVGSLAACTPRFEVPLPDVKVVPEDALVARGQYLFHGPAHCIACHADPKLGHALPDDALPVGGRVFPAGPFGTFYAANLTSCAETGLGRRSDAEIARVLKSAVAHDGTLSPMMRVAMGPLADGDITAIIAYLRSLEPVKHEVPPGELGALARVMGTLGMIGPRGEIPEVTVAPPIGPTVERGRYLAHGPAACLSCHTVLDPGAGFTPATAPFSGGETEPSALDERVLHTPPNLTPDPETGMTGKLDEEQWVARFRAGELVPGTKMPWLAYANMHEDDVRAIYRYLKTLAPVRNDVGPSVRTAE